MPSSCWVSLSVLHLLQVKQLSIFEEDNCLTFMLSTTIRESLSALLFNACLDVSNSLVQRRLYIGAFPD